MRVLVVEDDLMIGESLSEALQDEAYTVDWVKDGRQAILTLRVQPYDIILLDLGLPEVDGMGVLTAIRDAKIETPVLILTARDQLKDRIAGLDSGADDYVVKPFELGEVFARMRVLIRRAQGKADNQVTVGNLSLDTAHKRVMMDGSPIDLTAKEYMLLTTFMLSPEKVMSKNELEDSLYGWGGEVESNAIEFLIHSLRKKVGQDRIKNVRGLGWYISNA
ncbi:MULTISPECIES: response regulator [Psychrobacter]|jgi:two-component system OmpR family response regulator/two-component system response regulator QseB|uniref:DNA-binding response regulator n=3 Tax=Psychrobacter TaxID=497 RepID=A0A1G7AMF2_9GAMM|nr:MULTISPECIES: response regulator [Psychrobacter]MBK3394668.1 response regulator [Psychrobacter sp. M9-54-1]MCD1279995.1 DNA-binding response regulator [Psychrobacter sp. CCUG 69069]MDN6276681.1 response regulator [Psychrobacter sp.]PKG84265.1 DNA-binding response regulator [Psychrobacter sp. Sarcosine-02u-2]SDE15890.1 two component transcriptional regulator, winged helix family [Psychrobacter pacificensis]|tara:strand:+ start:9250 stop:9909 length:660 start_codon:yes stop_codon:yes gene_type:complete